MGQDDERPPQGGPGPAGLDRRQLLRPLDEPNARVIVGTWESRPHWEDWHDAPAFRQKRERLEGLQTGPAELTWHEAVLDRRGD